MTARAAWRRGAATLAAAGLPEASREARALLRAAAGFDPWLDLDTPLEPAAEARYRDWLARRAAREPHAYITGGRPFHRVRVGVRPGVLIPRPETELLVDAADRLAPRGARVCDLCTGSGAIALALAMERPDLRLDATDISEAALEVAADNVCRLGVGDRVALQRGDLWAALPAARAGDYAVCVCNPPYIDPRDWTALPPEVRDHEPRLALVAEQGYREMYRRIADGAHRWLAAGGWLVVEVGAGQAAAVEALFVEHGLRDCFHLQDVGGFARVVGGRWSGCGRDG